MYIVITGSNLKVVYTVSLQTHINSILNSIWKIKCPYWMCYPFLFFKDQNLSIFPLNCGLVDSLYLPIIIIMFYVIFWVLYIWELDIWDLPWCFMIFLRHRRPENFQFCWIRRVLAQCRAQGSVSDGLHQNTVLSEPRVRPEKWRPESSSSRTSSHQPPPASGAALF